MGVHAGTRAWNSVGTVPVSELRSVLQTSSSLICSFSALCSLLSRARGNRSWVRPRGSLNHIMLGGHAAWIGTVARDVVLSVLLIPTPAGHALGGIQLPDESVGWDHIRIAPSLTERISGFRAELDTVRGTICSSWGWTQPSAGSRRGNARLSCSCSACIA
jgi:hypothetical protein